MKTAYFDCFSGISGDMTLGALVDLGIDIEELKAVLATLPVAGYSVGAVHVQRCGIGGTLVKVKLEGEPHSHDHGHDHSHDHGHTHSHEHGHSHSHDHDHGHPHSHDHDHDHDHDHGHEHKAPHTHAHEGHPHHHEHGHSHDHAHDHHHEHGHSHDHGHDHHHQPHRGFSEISRIIQASGFSDRVKARAIEAFRRIAVEEAAVHETTVEAVHFHEVGAVDAIVDIVGAMWCLEKLGIERVLASPVAVGSGTVKAAHGTMPVPAPATARLLAGIPITTGPVTGELTTPTGAAILATVAESFGPLDNFRIEKIGYGAGSREYKEHTNYLRVLIGESTAGSAAGALPLQQERLHVITTEIDDMPAELFGHVLERLFDHGCLDVHAVPVHMKKNRPATSLHVLTTPDKLDGALEIIFRETTTFGLKVTECNRYSLRRSIEKLETRFGVIGVKIGYWGDEILKISPEFEDCRARALEHRVALTEVFSAAAAAIELRRNPS